MSSNHYYIIGPVADMRAEPSCHSEVVSQALFSEEVEVVDTFEDWSKIVTKVDGYSGWVSKHFLTKRTTPFPDRQQGQIVVVDRLAAHLYRVPDTIYGPLCTLPFESRLELREPPSSPDSRWLKVALPDGTEGFIQRGDVSFSQRSYSFHDICTFSQRFLGLPYTWGGRSSFGYDCSGFVQMLYRLMGYALPRDAKDQILWKSFSEVPLKDLKPGDLIFFGYSPDKIRHVGLHFENGRFIHAVASAENAPYIRYSHINDPAWNGSGLYPYSTARRLKKEG